MRSDPPQPPQRLPSRPDAHPVNDYDVPVARRRLPIGIQTFRELRERDCYYVDKTAYIERMLDEGKLRLCPFMGWFPAPLRR